MAEVAALLSKFRLLSLAAVALAGSPVRAEWRPVNVGVLQAAKDPLIAGALAQADRMDAAQIADDHAAFREGLAADLVVNNPQNRISSPGDTARMNAEGRIRYDSYARNIEYAGRRGELVVLMGEERVTRKGAGAGEVEVRRFTDLWRQEGGKWRLTLRQATIVPSH
jgi:hypothetical protein